MFRMIPGDAAILTKMLNDVYCRLLLYVCGIYVQLDSYLMEIDSEDLRIENRLSWVDAFERKPEEYELISPFLALDMMSEIRELTNEPVYVNGFTYGTIEKGGIIQMANSSEEHKIFCANAPEVGDNFFYNFLPKLTYEQGQRRCFMNNSDMRFFLTLKTLNRIDLVFKDTWFWMDNRSLDIPTLVLDNKTIYCIVLDLSEDDGKLMLDYCNRSRQAVYVKLAEIDEYKPAIKRYTNNSAFPFYVKKKSTIDTTTATSAGTSGSLFSSGKSSSNSRTKSTDDNGTVSPNPGTTGKKDLDSSSKDILGMNPDIFYAIVGVASLVLLTVIVCCLCCFCKTRKPKTKSGLALSNEYSNPVDSIAMKDPEMSQYPNNGVYANPQDSISPVTAKKRDSIEEGVYDVTFTSGQKKPNANPSNQPVNAYSHVTIVPPGGSLVDDTENHYDSTSHVKQQQKVLVSQSHSDNTYGEVLIQKTT